MIVHVLDGWLVSTAVLLLGSHGGRYCDSRSMATASSSIPFLTLRLQILIIGWLGFNVINAQILAGVSELMTVSSLLTMIDGTMAPLLVGRSDPGSSHNGLLAGLVVVCAGSGLMHPIGALATGPMAGALFAWVFTATQVC